MSKDLSLVTGESSKHRQSELKRKPDGLCKPSEIPTQIYGCPSLDRDLSTAIPSAPNSDSHQHIRTWRPALRILDVPLSLIHLRTRSKSQGPQRWSPWTEPRVPGTTHYGSFWFPGELSTQAHVTVFC
ncbi:hypothetical protein FSHL1_009560 [Fusarium sambucinum]